MCFDVTAAPQLAMWEKTRPIILVEWNERMSGWSGRAASALTLNQGFAAWGSRMGLKVCLDSRTRCHMWYIYVHMCIFLGKDL